MPATSGGSFAALDGGPLRVVVADDHPVVRDGVVALLGARGFEVVGEADDSERAIAICGVRRPDVLLLDYELPPGDAPAVIAAVRASEGATRILVFSAYRDTERARSALDAGADGYVTKGLRAAALVDAVRRAAGGERVVDAEVERALRDDAHRSQPTERQRAVIALVAGGATNREIAEALGITERTVKYHLRAVFDRLGASNRAEAVARAGESGWLSR
jgi:DNA-binding NarL/FixJ family response regulator